MKSAEFQIGETVVLLDPEGFRMGTGTIVAVEPRLSVVYEVELAPGDRRQFPESRLQRTDARAAGDPAS